MIPFDDLIKKSYGFNQKDYEDDFRWSILKELYEKNFISDEERNYNNLPRKIHQIWLGGVIPNKYKVYADTWKRFNPDWEYKLWTDNDVEGFGLKNKGLFDIAKNNGQRSDIFRYEILNRHGGVYIDTDFECLKSFNSLSYVDFLTGVGFPSRVELYIGLIGSVPHHPIITNIINAMNSIRGNGWRDIFETTGSYFFTRIFFNVVTGYMKDVVVLPTDYFYPFPNQSGHHLRNGRNYILPHSYAVHHWAVSWSKK